MASHQAKHDYHLVAPSPWPLLSALAVILFGLGSTIFLKGLGLEHNNFVNKFLGGSGSVLVKAFLSKGSYWIMLIGVLGILYAMIGWWGDVIQESKKGDHKPVVQLSLRYGMILFILQEAMFFVGWFWIFFELAFFHNVRAESFGGTLDQAWINWPPPGIETVDPLQIPLLNTLVLLLSGTTVTWAHHALITGDRKGAQSGLALTIILGLVFSALQLYEYSHSTFSLTENIYSSVFFLATGFHGLHVVIGTLFLFVCLLRLLRGDFSPEKHFGFEAAAWYWHFVDVVWLFLFAFIYVVYQ